MAAIECIYGCCQRGHCYIVPSQIPAYERRETDSSSSGISILAPQPSMLDKWFLQLC